MNESLKKTLVKVAVGGLVLLLAILTAIGYHLYIEYLQVKEIGDNFVSVFTTNLITQSMIQVVSFFCIFLLILFSFLRIRKTMMKVDISFSFLKKIFPVAPSHLKTSNQLLPSLEIFNANSLSPTSPNSAYPVQFD